MDGERLGFNFAMLIKENGDEKLKPEIGEVNVACRLWIWDTNYYSKIDLGLKNWDTNGNIGILTLILGDQCELYQLKFFRIILELGLYTFLCTFSLSQKLGRDGLIMRPLIRVGSIRACNNISIFLPFINFKLKGINFENWYL